VNLQWKEIRDAFARLRIAAVEVKPEMPEFERFSRISSSSAPARRDPRPPENGLAQDLLGLSADIRGAAAALGSPP